MDIEFAKSLSGHDKGQYYFIVKKDEEFVYLANGTTKTLAKLKKKKEKHIQRIKHLSDEIKGMFPEECSDITIKKAIKMYEKQIRG